MGVKFPPRAVPIQIGTAEYPLVRTRNRDPGASERVFYAPLAIILAAMSAPALQHGPYLTQPVIKGCRVTCLVRGVVNLVGLSAGPIPWPVGEKDGAADLVVYRGLARALQTESAGAVAKAWGISVGKVKAWQATGLKPPPTYIHVAKPLWTAAEDKALLAATSIKAFSEQSGRTIDACKVRRHHLRKKQPKAAEWMRKPPRQNKRK